MTDNWRQAFRRSLVKPVLIAQFTRRYHTHFTVTDFAGAAGVSYSVTTNAAATGNITIGVHHANGADNAGLATNMVTYLNATFPWLRASSSGAVVTVYAGKRYFSTTTEVLDDAQGTEVTSITRATTDATVFALAPVPTASQLQPYIRICSGDRPYIDTTVGTNESPVYPCCLHTVGTVSRSVDPLTRAFSSGTMELQVHDTPYMRSLVKNHGLRGGLVTLYLGTHDLAFDDFAPIQAMTIKSAIPAAEEPLIVFQLADSLGMIADETWAGAMTNRHPLNAMTDIMADIGMVDGTHYDSASFAPRALAISDRAHYGVSITNYPSGTVANSPELIFTRNAIQKPEPAQDLINELSLLAYGTVRPRASDGLVGFVPYHSDATVDRTLDMSEEIGYDIDALEMTDAGNDSIVNVVSFAGLEDISHTAFQPTIYTEADEQSLHEYGEVFKVSLTSRWLNAFAFVNLHSVSDSAHPGEWRNRFDSTAYAFDVGAPFRGFSGLSETGWGLGNTITIPFDEYAVNGVEGRWAYLGLDGQTNEEVPVLDQFGNPAIDSYGNPEYTFVNWTSEYIVCSDITEYSYYNAAIPSKPTPLKARYQIATNNNDFGFTNGRGGLGSTQRGWLVGKGSQIGFRQGGTINGGTSPENRRQPSKWFGENVRVTDITVQVETAKRILERFKNGCPRVRIACPLAHMDLEIADIVTITGCERYLSYGRDGLDANLVWEIIRKDFVYGDSPRVEFELARVRDAGAEDFVPVTTWPVYTPIFTPIIPIVPAVFHVITSDGAIVGARTYAGRDYGNLFYLTV
jgi:hypothetical protein